MSSIVRYLVFLLFLQVFSCFNGSAQPKCKIEHYSTEDGLSHDIITYILKDREGFMWFGTWNGINRFDGHRFVSYKSSPGDLSHLKSGRIDQIVEDEFLHLWIKAYDGQIYRFDKRTEQFLPLAAVLKKPDQRKRLYKGVLSADQGRVWLETEKEGLVLITAPQSDSSGYYSYHANATKDFRLPSDQINFFSEDKSGHVWVGTKRGLACLAKDNNGIYRNVYTAVLRDTGSFTGMTGTEDGNRVCFGTTDGRIGVFEKRSGRFFFLDTHTAVINAVYINKAQTLLYATTATGEVLEWDFKSAQVKRYRYPLSTALFSMYEDHAGNLWVEPEREGGVKFTPANGSFKTYRQKNNASYNYSGNHFKVFEDDQGLVWVNLKGGGFGYYNETSDAIAYFYNEPNAPNRLFSNIVNSVYYDRDGILWLRTEERSIEKITFQRNDFQQKLLVNPGLFRSDNEVRGLCEDRKGRLWMGVKGGKIYLLQNGEALSDLFVNMPEKGLGLVYTVLQDKKGAVWLGTKAHGLYRADPVNSEETKYRLTHFRHDPGDATSIGSDEIYSLLEDAKGQIWVGSFENGLNRVVVDQGRVTFMHDRNVLDNYPASFRKIRHMALDKQQKLWLATTNGLLIVNTGAPGKFTYKTYQKVPGDQLSLGSNDIQYIYRDAANTMWLATAGGLNRAIGEDPMKALQFRVYTTRDGLPNDYLLSCAEDRNHHLWIATQTGLSRLDLPKMTFRNYNSYDGVPPFSFSEASGIRLKDGRLVFGTLKGYLTFDPQLINDHHIQAGLAFTNLQVNNVTVTADEKNGVLQSAVNYAPSLTLRYNQNIISFDYGVLDFRSNNKQSYAWYLKGFDTGWQTATTERRATYTNLPPGDYVFEVKCVNKELYSNVPVKSIPITILPPPWKTGWAYCIYVLLALALLALIRRNALTMLRLRHKIAVEKKIAELKLNFFTNVSHELRTPMTLIINPIEEISKQEALSERGRQYIEVVRKNANRMARFVNQLLDLRKLQSGKARLSVSRVEMVSFLETVSGYFTELAREKNIDFRVMSDAAEIEAWIDIDKVETVMYNLVANAFKFTPEGKVITIRVQSLPAQQAIQVEVYDQGAGVPADQLDLIFELFYEGEDAQEKHIKGTGIGLALSKEMIILHGGEIIAANNDSGGLTVTVTLPVGTGHRNSAGIAFTDSIDTYPVTGTAAAEPVLLSTTDANHNDLQHPLILLVEDNTDLQRFLESQLTASYRVAIAGNGEEGLRKALELQPDLILSDVMMPKMNGIQMLDQLKKNITTSHIPVILLTARSAVESQVEGLNYGADYYITKPFKHDFLVAAIANLIRQRKKVLAALLEGKKTVQLEPGEIQITSQDEQFLQKIVHIIEDKMADTEFNIDTVAEAMSMSRTAFYKKFKSLTGLAPVEFVREMRLKRACQYLDAGYGNVSEIAYTVGFSNARYFSTCFKARFGTTPTEYVKQKPGSASAPSTDF
jgi:signal transduction histidine kinase/ligand-binding sensor domain-containing protein/DNA-binding response OmpR family regulator